MSSEPLRKQEEDLTPQCDQIIPAAEALASAGKTQDGLDKLLALEKQARNASDLSSTSRVLISIISILYQPATRDLKKLNEHLVSLSKKHGQLRQATVKMVEKAMEFVNELASGSTDKEDLIATLRDITEGKIYLEVQRARVTRQLSQIREAEGSVQQASELMQDLQVETFGSMDRREKVDFILEQMRLLKLQEDWEKLAIVAKRINLRWLTDKENEDLKLRYYSLMILHGLHKDAYLEVCKYYRAVYDSPSINESTSPASTSTSSPNTTTTSNETANAILRNIVFFVILAPYDNEQSDLLNRVYRDERLKEMKECYDLVKCFIDPELRRWPNIEELYGDALRKTKVFGPKGTPGVDGDIEEADQHAKGDERWKVLHDRIVEHNIRVVATYYTRITLSRLSSFLNLDVPETEKFLSHLVTSKTVWAKIDRPAGVVNFVKPKRGDDVLNEWSSDVGKLMGLIEKSCHLIAKENAVNAALKAQQAKA